MCLFLITLGEPVSYPANQVDGFELTIEKPTWSPFKGYTIRWAVTANSKEIYSFGEDGSPGFEYLERHIDGQWYRLTYSQDIFPFNNLEFSLGGDSTGLQGSIVQKYDYYGTRLEAGTYRVVLEMKAKDGTPHYLAAEFDVVPLATLISPCKQSLLIYISSIAIVAATC